MIELQGLIDEHGVVGAQFAVLADGEITDVAAGVLSAGTRAPVTTESLFQIASITKVWTATLVQELVNEGRLDLDGPVCDVLPGWPAGSALAMSARDLPAFARMHLATPAFAVMREPQMLLPDCGNRASWGLGWELPGYSGGPVIGHHGANRGMASFLRIAPERGIAVALLTSGGAAREVFDDIIDNVFSELAGVRRPEPPTPPEAPELVDERFLGTYRCADHEVVVTQADHGRVRVDLDDDVREFVALRDDALIALERPHTVLVLKGDLLHFGRAAART
ncbi:Beta-lactamase [Lentzea albidocapillata subsp. violacea]|uniref:Beta-lactamase n=1 Tax=Lentzea albidocapillata subsp. violacea TaxID=128104 RepID=A0A1G9NU63_9PSEU|nr:serine hydrolase domain-containing protein [Lentzea albidocapillata]SDL90128.1 Beta-lactamase [Lentzea albidocapillata subsp. violacea]